MNKTEEISERRQVEDYLKLYCIEEVIDETLNTVLESRPPNPYLEIAKIIQAKTVPEIIDVKINSIVCGNGSSGVESIVITNLGSFHGQIGDSFELPVGADRLRNFLVIQEKVCNAIKNIDPCDINKIDETLLSIPGIEAQVALTVSIACARAGAYHSGKSLFRHISNLAGTEIGLPMPTASILSRSLGDETVNISQLITLTPTSASTVESAIEALMQASLQIKKTINSRKLTLCMSASGCPCSNFETVNESIKFVVDAIREADIAGDLKPGIDMKSSSIANQRGEEEALKSIVAYFPNGEGDGCPQLNGIEICDSIILCWKSFEIISVEDSHHMNDLDSLKYLKEVRFEYT